jgi:hypothetical protein
MSVKPCGLIFQLPWSSQADLQFRNSEEYCSFKSESSRKFTYDSFFSEPLDFKTDLVSDDNLMSFFHQIRVNFFSTVASFFILDPRRSKLTFYHSLDETKIHQLFRLSQVFFAVDFHMIST